MVLESGVKCREMKANLFIVAGYFTLNLHNAFLHFISSCIIMNMKMIIKKNPTKIAILFIYLNILREKLHYLKI